MAASWPRALMVDHPMRDTFRVVSSRPCEVSRRARWTLLAVVPLGTLATGCASDESPETPETPEANSVCGFFPTSMVEQFLGVAGPGSFTADGSTMVSKQVRQTDTATCVVLPTRAWRPRLSAVIVEYGDQHSRSSVERQIDQEIAKHERCFPEQAKELGEGSVCLFNDSTQLALATDQRLIRIELVSRKGDGVPAGAVAALTFARQADNAADSFDQHDSNRAGESTP